MNYQLKPDKTMAYYALLLSELAICQKGVGVISPDYVNLHFHRISMPPVFVTEAGLNEDQVNQLKILINQNLHSSMFRFASISRHWERKTSAFLNSNRLDMATRSWLIQPENESLPIEASPRGIAEIRLHARIRKAVNHAMPGYKDNQHYTDYLNSVLSRLS